ncbi:diguanylate cyclase [Murimonas intestini]|uniref:bifunctional diguanylate cyclase/phosphohydrolase n=1 Tax=Murimonas intestini TaxID=1337051 RepID=UPI0011DDEC4A|nr:diguanylate cyclase [Murimonas intestini]
MEPQDKIMLVVDDMELNRAILNELFSSSYKILEAENGKEALKLIEEYGTSIVIVLLDLIMPVMNGFEVLRHLSSSGLIEEIPVVMITSESSEQAILEGYNLNATDVITKPFNPDIVRKRVENTVELNSYKQHLENKVQSQVDTIEKQSQELEKVNNFIIDTLSTIVEFRDVDTGQHVKRIRMLTKVLLYAVVSEHREYAMSEEDINVISSAAAMHDIGKISIPDHILLKPGKLTKEEFEIMKTHTTKGCKLLDSLNYVKTSDYFRFSYDICRYHHERWDGGGYPDGLKGDGIPIWAQVVGLADVYDALTRERVYKPAYSHETAVKMILDGECGIFNPALLDAFLKVQDIIRLDEELLNEEMPSASMSVEVLPEEKRKDTQMAALKERTLWLLEMEREKYRILAELSGEVIFNYDLQKDCVEFSEKCREQLGCEEYIENFSDYMEKNICVYPEDRQEAEKLSYLPKRKHPNGRVQVRLLTARGDYEWFEINAYVLTSNDGAHEDIVYIGKLSNINKQKLEKEKLRIDATTDNLTGLCNYKNVKDMIRKYLKAGHGGVGAFVFIDIDDFKAINDTFGHLAGDSVLKAMGNELKKLFRSSDIMGRIGGDEFIVFIKDIDSDILLAKKMDELLRKVENIRIKEDNSCRASVSIGLSCCPRDGKDYRELFIKADKALYDAKHKGKNQFTIYNAELETRGHATVLTKFD